MITRAINNNTRRSLAAFGLLILVAASAASAQAQTSGAAAVFRVPFEFTAGGVRLPAGDYTVQRTSQAGLAYFVRSTDGHRAAAVSVESALRARGEERPLQLNFDVYGGQYFLAEVWATGDGTGIGLRASRAERDMAKRASSPERVTVAALAN